MIADDLRPGDRYELHEGHPLYCAPTGGDDASRQGLGFSVLDTDPAVTEAGVDPGYSPEPEMLRAPDIGVGNVPDAPGWVVGVPPLAVEYAGRGQNEQELGEKIDDLLDRGTQLIWVVRLTEPRHVEVHRPGQTVEHVPVDGTLTAPGVLANPVAVRALLDREAAHDATLRNLLQRRGYDSLEAVRVEGQAEGRAEGLRTAIADLCEAVGVELTDEHRARLDAATLADLEQIRAAVKKQRRWPA